MNPYKFLIILLLFCWQHVVFGQDKQPLDEEVYDIWQSLSQPILSDDGRWTSYVLKAEKRDGFLYLYDWDVDQRDSIARGYKAAFSQDAQFLVFQIRPPMDSTRKAKLAKKKKDQMPKDSLGIWLTATGQLSKVPDVLSYKVPQKGGNWIAYLTELQEKEAPEPDSTQKEKTPAKKKKKKKIKTLVLLNPISGEKKEVGKVESYQLSDNGKSLGWIEAYGDSIDSVSVRVFNTETSATHSLYAGPGKGKRLVFDQLGTQASFMISQDTGKVKVYELWHWQEGNESGTEIVSQSDSNMPENWAVSEHGKTGFSEDGKRLYFGTAPAPVEEPEDSLLEEEKAKLDVWNWQDPRLQPQQSVELKRDQKKSFRAVWLVEEQKMVQLASEQIPRVDSLLKGNGNIAMGIDDTPYLKQRSWEWPSYRDVYAVEIESGKAKKVLSKVQYANRLSPGGTYVYWYDPADQNWYVKEIESDETRNLTQEIDAEFFNKLHNSPNEPYPYPLVGWGEEDAFVLLTDYFDLWKIDPSGESKPINLTRGFGKKNNIRFQYQRLDRESPFVETTQLLLLGTDDLTKEMGMYTIALDGKKKPQLLMKSPHLYRSFVKAKQADRMIWRKESFSEYPDLYISDQNFEEVRKISHANPQQSSYLWGTVEMTHWTSYDGNQLAGRLYRPENFDPSLKYPMIVYFYERSSGGIHRYSMPSPSRSTVYPSIYASNGYVIFIPDIVYKTGQPGLDAYNAVMSGTDHVLEKYPFIDSTKMALQGHSWGGYQIAHIITQTDRYAAVMAGAPVSNMTSAYGGIRWSSGYSRMFQYEETQSRLGTTLWENTDRYMKNSPLFYAPQIETPLLMMHNDKDGAVPWYQGIEFFVALRRLNKPVWMLVYNGEGHNLRGWANRKDLSRRMMQYFDHFLKDKPMPVWMSEGIPAIEKGKKSGFSLGQSGE